MGIDVDIPYAAGIEKLGNIEWYSNEELPSMKKEWSNDIKSFSRDVGKSTEYWEPKKDQNGYEKDWPVTISIERINLIGSFISHK